MNLRFFALTPWDAWFFRDGRPYHHGESNQADVPSVFPPSPRTLSGALRAALARANGWDHGDRWPAALNRTLGDGPNDLGTLQFMGPFLIRTDRQETQPLWPAPRHLLGHARPPDESPETFLRRIEEAGNYAVLQPRPPHWSPETFLRPDEVETETDLGRALLPRPALAPGKPVEALKPADNLWITAAGLSKILAGQLPRPSDLWRAEQLWSHESRIGLRRDPQSHHVGEGDLYSPRFVRLDPRVALGVGMGPLPDDWKPLRQSLLFGGESRMAMADPWPHSALPEPPPLDSFVTEPNNIVRFVIVLLTPGRFPKEHGPARSLSPGVKTVSACIGRPQWIGGWDSLNRKPLPLEPFYPAGSVWFCETDAHDFPQIHAKHGQWLGEYTQHGFGQIAIGLWPPNPVH